MKLPALLIATALASWSQIGVNTGDLKIEPKYLGQTLDQLSAAFEISVFVDGSERGTINRHFYNNYPPVSSLTILGLAEGSHTVQYLISSFGFFGSHNVTVAQGSLTTDNFELASLMGVITGNLFINGAPPTVDYAYAVCGMQNSNIPRYLPANTSAFRILVPAGSRNGSIYRQSTGVIKVFPYVAVAGQDVDLGTITFNAGDLKIEPKYLGQTLDQVSAAFEISVFVDGSERGTINRHFYNNYPPVSSLTISGLAEGSHTVQYLISSFGFFGSHSVTVAQGALTTDNFELSSLMGVIKGNLFVNGAPPSVDYSYAVCGMQNSNIPRYLPANTSAFRILVPAGSRNGSIYRQSTGVIKLFPYTSLAGQDVDLGTITFNTGDLKIEPKYLGQTLDQISAAFEISVFVDGSERGTINRHFYNNYPPVSSLTISGLAEGSHTVQYLISSFGFFGSHNVTVAQGALTTDNFELSSLMGVIKGNLFVNGAPPTVDYSYAVCGMQNSNIPRYLAANTSAFRILVPAGSRNGSIYRQSTGVIKLFPYTALAGQDVIVGDPFQLNLLGTLSAKSGPANARIWQYSLKNLDSGAVSPSVSAFSLTQTFGTACTPVISTATPVAYGLIAPNVTANASFTIDFSSCAATARFTLNVTAASGAVSQSFTHNQLFR